MDATDQAQVKAAVDEALAGWEPPLPGSKWNGYIWVIAVLGLVILMLAFGAAFILAELDGKTDTVSAGLGTYLTLLVGGFLGFVGGAKAAGK